MSSIAPSCSSTLPPLRGRGPSLMARAAEELRLEARDGIRPDAQHTGNCHSTRGLSLDLDFSKRFGTREPNSTRTSSRGVPSGPVLLGRAAPSLASQKQVMTPGQQHLTLASARGHRNGTHLGARDRDHESQDERKLRDACELIGVKAAQKFGTVGEAFRYLVDPDHDGKISRTQVQYFFRAYDISPLLADSFFDKLDYGGAGVVEYNELTKVLAHYIQPEQDGCEWSSQECDTQASTRTPSPSDLVEEQAGKREPMCAELADTLKSLGQKAKEKFSHAIQVFSEVDCNDNGRISRKEMRHFYKQFNLAKEQADQLFNFMRKEQMLMMNSSACDVSYCELVRLLEPFLQEQGLQGVRGAVLQKPLGSPPSSRFSRRVPVGSSTSGSTASSCAFDGNKTVNVSADPWMKLSMRSGATLAALDETVHEDAFPSLDLRHNGKIERAEMRSFLRGFGWSHDVADRIFASLDEDRCGQIDFNIFMCHFQDILGPANRPALRLGMVAVQDDKLREEVNQLAGILGEKLLTKFGSARDALRTLDLSNDGRITKSDMRLFFRLMCMPLNEADRLFKCLCMDGADFLDYNVFLALFGQAECSWRAGSRRQSAI